MRWVRSFGALAVITVLFSATLSAAAGPATTLAPSPVPGQAAAVGAAPTPALLTLRAQTSWVTPTAPWFTLSLGVASSAGAAADLHVELTYYSRINDDTHMAQASNANATPDEGVLRTVSAPVTATATGLGVVSCAVVLPNNGAEAPTPAPGTLGVCPPGAPTVSLHCEPGTGSCGDVYPVTVALYQQGNSTALARFTTFLTYQEPAFSASVSRTGGALRVGVILPVASPPSSVLAGPSAADRRAAQSLIEQVWNYRGTPLTLAANPLTVSALATEKGGKGALAVKELSALETPADGDQLLSQPYVPIDPAALARVNLSSEVGAQMVRGDGLLRLSDLHPTSGTWDTTSASVSTANAADLATGLAATHSTRLIVNDSDLTSAGVNNLTFAQPFSLPLGHSAHVTAAGADSQIDALFTAYPRNPLLAANLLLANLEFVHFENAFKSDPRGVIIEPPQFWQPPKGFLTVLLYGLTQNPALTPVNLDQFFAQVHKGGNGEPATRHLKSGSTPAAAGMTLAQGRRLQTARTNLTSLSGAVGDARRHPPVFAILADLLLRTESATFDQSERLTALETFTDQLDAIVRYVSLGIQGTITFTSRTAPIPVSVLSSAPFPIRVVLSLDSDKFTFPQGNSRTLTLNRPTTPVRIQARSRTSGDRLPVGVTLTTPDGQLVLARAALTIHSTSISLVGVGLTALAGLVLLVWWGRTWRRSRRRRPRAA